MQKSLFEAQCLCNLLRNGNDVPIGTKAKPKRVRVYAFYEKENQDQLHYLKHPFLQVENNSSNSIIEPLFRFQLRQITKLNQSLSSQGRMTFDFWEGSKEKIAHLCLSLLSEKQIEKLIACIKGLLQKFVDQSKRQSEQLASNNNFEQNNQEIERNSQQISNDSNQAIEQSPRTIIQANSLWPANKPKPFQFVPEKRTPMNNLQICPPRPKQSLVEDKEIFKFEKNNLEKTLSKIITNTSLFSDISTDKKVKVNKRRAQSKGQENDVELDQEEVVFLDSNSNKAHKEPEIGKKQKLKSNNKINNSFTTFTIDEIKQQKTLIEQFNQLKQNLDKQNQSVQVYSKDKSNNSTLENDDAYSSRNNKSLDEINLATIKIKQFDIFNGKQAEKDKVQVIQPEKQELIPAINKDFQKVSENQKVLEISTFSTEKHQKQRQLEDEQELLQQQGILEEKRKLREQQLALYDKQLLLTQQEKQMKLKLAEKKIRDLQEEHRQLETTEQEILQARQGIRNSFMRQEELYYCGKKGDETQYEKEQKMLQLETEKQLQEGNQLKYSSFQDKLKLIKEKQQQQKVIVNGGNNSNQQKNETGNKLGLKRRNPFESNEEEDNINSRNQFQIQKRAAENEQQLQDLLQNNQEELNNSFIYMSPTDQSKESDNQTARSKALQILGRKSNNYGKEIIASGDSVSLLSVKKQNECNNGVSVKKLGKKYVQTVEKIVMRTLNDSTDEEWKKCLELLSERLLGHVMLYLRISERINLRLLSQKFNKGFMYSISKLMLTQSELPYSVVRSFLQSPQVSHLELGRLPLVPPQKLQSLFTLSSIKMINLTNYIALSDELLLHIERTSSNLESMILPYFSNINQSQILHLPNILCNLTHLSFSSSLHGYYSNPAISDMTLAVVICKLPCLKSFSVFTVTSSFFRYLQMTAQKENISLENMKSLEIINLKLSNFSSSSDETLLEQLGFLKHIEKLRILNLLRKIPELDFEQYHPSKEVITKIFSSFVNLMCLTVGDWGSNDILTWISRSICYIKEIELVSNIIDDSGLVEILRSQHNLEIVDIRKAHKIEGDCFKEVSQSNLKVVKTNMDKNKLINLKQLFLKSKYLSHVRLFNIY